MYSNTVPQKQNIFQLTKQISTVDIIHRYRIADLHRRGQRWVACCPLHGERKPSFYVFPDGGWKCFGCGEHGDAVDLLVKVYGLRPIEAARMIARDYGLEMDGPLPTEVRRKAEQATKERWAEQLFEQKLNETLGELQVLYRCTHRALALGGWQAYMELNELVHQLPMWEYLLDGLLDRDVEVQAEALVNAGRYLDAK